MHVGRFHHAVKLLAEYFRPKPIDRALGALLESLKAYAAGPTPETSTAFRNALNLFVKVIDELKNLPRYPSFNQIAQELGAGNYIDGRLKDGVVRLLEAKSFTPTELVTELENYRTQLNEFMQKIQNLANNLDALAVEYVDIKEAEYEFGALLPRELVGETLFDLIKEFEHLSRFFGAINELAGKGNESPAVRTISSSWWQIFLALDSVQIGAAALAIERIVAIYKTNLEIRKLKGELATKELEPEILALIEKAIEEKLRNGLKAVAGEIRVVVEKIEDNGRANELESQLRIELLHMAKRINQGAAYEARAGLPNKPEEPTEEQKQQPQIAASYSAALADYEQKMQLAETVNKANTMTLADAELPLGGPLLIDYDKEAETEGSAPIAKT